MAQSLKVLITGAKGFIGKNLAMELKNREMADIFEYDVDTESALLDEYCRNAEFVFHLAGVNRPQNPAEFMTGNFGFTLTLLDTLKKHKNNCPVMISSSIQAELDNSYGKSKKAGEELLFAYSQETGARVLVYRFPNVFGKWCKPNYNSAVATFCHNLAHGLTITVNDPNVVMNLVYIDDVVEELIQALNGKENKIGYFCEVPVVHTATLGEIVRLIQEFQNSREALSIPDMSDAFVKKLYSTYLSYLPNDRLRYELKTSVDKRGSFTEFLKTPDSGQLSVNVTKPGITKGNHWHHTKCEKFLVVSGRGVIRFRQVNSEEINEYYVGGDKPEVLDIPPGYTHNIENLGETDLVTIMWANELFDPDKPDTYYLEV